MTLIMKKIFKKVCASQPPPQKKKNAWNQMLCRASTAVIRRGKSTVTILKVSRKKAINYNKHEDWKKRIANQNWVI